MNIKYKIIIISKMKAIEVKYFAKTMFNKEKQRTSE